MSVPAQFLLCDTVFDRLTRRHCLQVSAKTAVHSLLTKQVHAYLLVRLMTVLHGNNNNGIDSLFPTKFYKGMSG